MADLTTNPQYICANVSQFRPLGDRILLRPMKWEPSKILEVVRHGRTLRGEVLAVGPGINPAKYKHRNDKKLMDYSRHFRRTEIKVGDVVELGGLNIYDGKGYQFTEVLIGTEVFVVCTERDVAIVCEPDEPDETGTEDVPRETVDRQKEIQHG